VLVGLALVHTRNDMLLTAIAMASQIILPGIGLFNTIENPLLGLLVLVLLVGSSWPLLISDLVQLLCRSTNPSVVGKFVFEIKCQSLLWSHLFFVLSLPLMPPFIYRAM